MTMMSEKLMANQPKLSPPKQRHLALLIALLVLFILSPIILTHRFGVVLMNIVGAAVFFSGTYAVRERKRLFAITILLAVVSIGADILLQTTPSDLLVLVAYATVLLLMVVFSVSILSNVLQSGRVTADKIYGAICVYLLVAYAWAFAYAIIESCEPGSFAGLNTQEHLVRENISRVIQLRYFSFVTLTTVGYGDITPHSPLARTLSMIEAVMGQMYLAILVARLVGLHIVDAAELKAEETRHQR